MGTALVILGVGAVVLATATALLVRRAAGLPDDLALPVAVGVLALSMAAMLFVSMFPVTATTRTVDTRTASAVQCGSMAAALTMPDTIQTDPAVEPNPAAGPCHHAGHARAWTTASVPAGLGVVGLLLCLVPRRSRVVRHVLDLPDPIRGRKRDLVS